MEVFEHNATELFNWNGLRKTGNVLQMNFEANTGSAMCFKIRK